MSPGFYWLGLLVAALTTALALPLWRGWSIRVGLVDDPGHRKIHHQPVPLCGGWAVLTGLMVPLLLAALAVRFLPDPALRAKLDYGMSKRALELAAILGGALGMVVLGWLDDKHELKAAPKFGGQLLVAMVVAAAGIRVTLFVPNMFFSYGITILWILTVTNAFNFMDNMNGLCAGLGVIGAGLFAVLAATHGQYLVGLIAAVGCGALLGFLPYNFPRGSVFLGDAGSHLVGYLLAVLAILPHFYTSKHPHPWAVLKPLLVLAVPLADLVWVVILRWRRGQPFYIGDTNHLSHRLARSGLSRVQSVMLIWLLAALIGAIGLLF